MIVRRRETAAQSGRGAGRRHALVIDNKPVERHGLHFRVSPGEERGREQRHEASDYHLIL